MLAQSLLDRMWIWMGGGRCGRPMQCQPPLRPDVGTASLLGADFVFIGKITGVSPCLRKGKNKEFVQCSSWGCSTSPPLCPWGPGALGPGKNEKQFPKEPFRGRGEGATTTALFPEQRPEINSPDLGPESREGHSWPQKGLATRKEGPGQRVLSLTQR